MLISLDPVFIVRDRIIVSLVFATLSRKVVIRKQLKAIYILSDLV